MKPITLLLTASLALATSVQARLGETEEQSQARYGAPVADEGDRPGAGPGRRQLLEGAKEVAYDYQGWRIRSAFVNKVAVRIEYSRPGGSITEKQAEAILDAEKGALRWKAVKDERNDNRSRRGPGGPGRGPQREDEWVRTDKATAKLHERDSSIVIESAAVTARDKKQATAVPKF